MFDDPFFAVTLLMPNPVSAFFSNLWQVLFVSFFMFFLLCTFHSITADKNQKHSTVVSKSKIALCSLFCLVSLILNFTMSIQFYSDPSFRPGSENMNALLIFLVFYILVVMSYFCLLFKYYIQACCLFKSLLNRHQIFLIFSSFFILCVFVFVISGSYQIHFMDSPKVLLTMAITNLYVWFMLYFYSPSRKGL